MGYNLYVKKPGALVFARVTSHPISDTSVKLKNLKNGMNYDFELSSVSAAGRESAKVRVSAVPTASALAAAPVPTAAPSPVVLAPPTGFKVVSAGVGLSLSWNKSPAPAAGYNLYLAGETGNPPKKMSPKPLVETLANIKNAATDKTYRFFLTSVDTSGVESAPASAVYVPTPVPTPVPTTVPAAFPAPESFNAVPGDGSASLSWSEVPGAVGYKLYASSDGKAFDLLTPQAKTGLKAVLKPLTNGQAYYFAVTALALDGRESAKKIQSVLPAPDPNR